MKKSAQNCTLYHVVNKSVWADIGAANQLAPIYWYYERRNTNILVLLVLAAPILVLLVLAAPTGEDTQTFYNFKNFADFLKVYSANILVLTGLQHQYIGAVQGDKKCLQHHTYSLNIAYSVSWSKRKWKYKYSKMAAKLKTKRTSITTMGTKIQAFDIFQTPLSSHYPLPLSTHPGMATNCCQPELQHPQHN